MSLEIEKFDRDALLDVITNLLSRRSLENEPERLSAAIASISDKKQFNAVFDLAMAHGANAMVIETEYVDKHYLEDYAGYYARCFEKYGRRCARVHFYRAKLSEIAFLDQLVTSPKNDRALGDELGYIGYVVLKPLPHTVIGRTAIPPICGTKDHFPTLKEYKTQIGGRNFYVETALFQEQDHEVAACATVAIWSILSTTASMLDNQILSPFEITKKAGEKSNFTQRLLPNDGLNQYQVLTLLTSSGLDYFYFSYRSHRSELLPYVLGEELPPTTKKNKPKKRKLNAINAVKAAIRDDAANAKALLFAFLRGGNPCLLNVDILRNSGKSRPDNHAVAAVGYSLKDRSGTPIVEERPDANATAGAGPKKPHRRIPLVADRIDSLYVVDDNQAPFANYRLSDDGIIEINDDEKAYVNQIIVPIYHKVRQDLPATLKKAEEFDYIIGRLIPDLDCCLEWEIYLSDIATLKNSIRNSAAYTFDKNRFVFGNAPRFIWVLTAIHDGKEVLTILLDATDLRQGGSITNAIRYSSELCKPLVKAAAGARDDKNWLPLLSFIREHWNH